MPTKLLHIAHAGPDRAWVHGALLDALRLPTEQYRTREQDVLGGLRIAEIEDAVRECTYTLLVASRAAHADDWVRFAADLAQHLGLEEGRPRLLVVTRDYAPGSPDAVKLQPLRERCLAHFDCSDLGREKLALTALAAQLAIAVPEPLRLTSPYPGLRTFDVDDSANGFGHPELFFGRDEEAADILAQLTTSHRLLLAGPSGCGKSSLLRASVVPKLTQRMSGLEVVTFRPGAKPDHAMRVALTSLGGTLDTALDAYVKSKRDDAAAQALATAAGGPARLLFVDQLEEAFADGDASDADERAAFLARLSALQHVPGVMTLLSMRADFYDEVMRSPLWNRFKASRVDLAPLRGEALEAAITHPAAAVGVYVEDALVERLVREADQDRAAEALPLLQVALDRLWKHREWRYLSLASYEQLLREAGATPAQVADRGLDVVFARHAEAALDALPASRRPAALRILVDLVHVGEGRPNTRRRRSSAQLASVIAPDTVDDLIDHLADHRLVVMSGDAAASHDERYVDLAHDALITGWPLLANWLRGADVQRHRRLETRAELGGTLDARELPEFVAWIERVDLVPYHPQGASLQLRALVRESERVLRRRRMRLVALMTVIVAVAIVAIWQSLVARREAARRQQMLAASYQDLGRQLVVDGHTQRALPYLIASLKLQPPNPILKLLLHQALQIVPRLTVPNIPSVSGVGFSPDGTMIATAPRRDAVQIRDATTGEPLGKLIVQGDQEHDVRYVGFSPDGTCFVAGSDNGIAQLWGTRTGEPCSPVLKHGPGPVFRASFSPDGQRIATASYDHHARVWNTKAPQPVWQSPDQGEDVRSVEISADGHRLLSAANHGVRIWNLDDASPGTSIDIPTGLLSGAPGSPRASFSPDGQRVLVAQADPLGSAGIFDATTKTQIALLKHQRQVWAAVYSPDGHHVVSAGDDHVAKIWDADTHALRASLQHQASVLTVAVSKDNRYAMSASQDGTARLWDLATGQPVGPWLEHGAAVQQAVFSADSKHVLTSGQDNQARIWDIEPLTERVRVLHLPARADRVVLDVRSKHVLTTDTSTDVRLWEAGTGKLIKSIGHDSAVTCALFNPTRNEVLTCTARGQLQRWDADTAIAVGEPWRLAGGVNAAVFSADGARLLTTSGSTVQLWDASTGAQIGSPRVHGGPVSQARLAADGQILTSSTDGVTRWDVQNTAHVLLAWPGVDSNDMHVGPDGMAFAVHQDGDIWVWRVRFGVAAIPMTKFKPCPDSMVDLDVFEFSADGTHIATTCDRNVLKLWDATTGELAAPPIVQGLDVTSVAFASDGTRLVTTTRDQHSPNCEQDLKRTSENGWNSDLPILNREDRSTQVWDIATGKQVTPWLCHECLVNAAVFSPDGNTLATSSDDKTVKLWDVGPDETPLNELARIAQRVPFELRPDGVLTERQPVR